MDFFPMKKILWDTLLSKLTAVDFRVVYACFFVPFFPCSLMFTKQKFFFYKPNEMEFFLFGFCGFCNCTKYYYLFKLFFINVPIIFDLVCQIPVRNLLKHTHTRTHKNSESMWIGKEFECWEIETANFASVGISGGKNMYKSHYLCRKCGCDTIFGVEKNY